jgi:hypothetical protein
MPSASVSPWAAGASFERVSEPGNSQRHSKDVAGSSGQSPASSNFQAVAAAATVGTSPGSNGDNSCAPCSGGPLKSAHSNLVGSSVLKESAYTLKYGARGATMAFVASEPITGKIAGWPPPRILLHFACWQHLASCPLPLSPSSLLPPACPGVSRLPGMAHTPCGGDNMPAALGCLAAGSTTDWVAVPKNTALVITREKAGHLTVLRAPLAADAGGADLKQSEVYRCAALARCCCGSACAQVLSQLAGCKGGGQGSQHDCGCRCLEAISQGMHSKARAWVVGSFRDRLPDSQQRDGQLTLARAMSLGKGATPRVTCRPQARCLERPGNAIHGLHLAIMAWGCGHSRSRNHTSLLCCVGCRAHHHLRGGAQNDRPRRCHSVHGAG